MFYLKLLIFSLGTLLILPSLFASNTTSELYLEVEGFCPTVPIDFKIYNLSQWEEKDEINSDEDREFQNISNIEYIVYEGPFNTHEILFEGSVNKTGEFNLTLPKTNRYLIEITASGFDPFSTRIELEECKSLFEEEKEGEEKEKEDEKYTFEMKNDGIQVTINNANINLQNPLQITKNKNNIVNTSTNKDALFEIEIEKNSPDLEFENLEITIENISDKNISINKMDPQTKEILKTIEYQLQKNSLVFTTNTQGTFIVEKKIETSEKPEETVFIDETPAQTQSTNSIFPYLIGGVFLIIILFIIYGFFHKGTHKKGNNQEIIHSYSQEYKRTKEYVQRYKNSFPKEGIEKMLVQAQVPRDIILRVFKEEYNK